MSNPARDISVSSDIETSSEEYARRFSGNVGTWLLEVQAEAVLNALRELTPSNLLELGGGHAQLVGPLLDAGYSLTIVGSAQECRSRLTAFESNPRFTFQAAELLSLPFEAKRFDVVLSVRYISHCPEWPRLIAEMCRVARHGVLIDYPKKSGFNLLAEVLFGLKRRIEGNTRRYLSFSSAELDQEFAKHGFKRRWDFGQFVLPMVFHRQLKFVGLSKWLERLLHLAGLSRLFGNPVIACYERNPSADTVSKFP